VEILAIALSVIALLVALAARTRAGAQATRIEDSGRDARRRNENLAEELGRGLDNMRRLMAELAQGNNLTREMILEGRLWGDMNPAEGELRLAAGELRVLDVRNPAETQSGVIPGAQLIPVDSWRRAWASSPGMGSPCSCAAQAAGGRPQPANSSRLKATRASTTSRAACPPGPAAWNPQRAESWPQGIYFPPLAP